MKMVQKIHSNAHQAGQRWCFTLARCGILLYVNIKLFIEFIFSVANNSSSWLKEEEDITDAESNEKRNWLIAEKMWNYFRFLPWMTAFNLINRSEQNPRVIFGMKTLLTQWQPWICMSMNTRRLMHRYRSWNQLEALNISEAALHILFHNNTSSALI